MTNPFTDVGSNAIPDGQSSDLMWGCVEVLGMFVILGACVVAATHSGEVGRRVWQATTIAAVAWVLTVGHPGGPVATEVLPNSQAGAIAPRTGPAAPVARSVPAGVGRLSFHRTKSFYINGDGSYGRMSLKVTFSRWGLWRTAAIVCGQTDGPCIDMNEDRVVVQPIGAGKYQVDTIPPAAATAGYEPSARTFIVGYSLIDGSRAGWYELLAVTALLLVTAWARSSPRLDQDTPAGQSVG